MIRYHVASNLEQTTRPMFAFEPLYEVFKIYKSTKWDKIKQFTVFYFKNQSFGTRIMLAKLAKLRRITVKNTLVKCKKIYIRHFITPSIKTD